MILHKSHECLKYYFHWKTRKCIKAVWRPTCLTGSTHRRSWNNISTGLYNDINNRRATINHIQRNNRFILTLPAKYPWGTRIWVKWSVIDYKNIAKRKPVAQITGLYCRNISLILSELFYDKLSIAYINYFFIFYVWPNYFGWWDPRSGILLLEWADSERVLWCSINPSYAGSIYIHGTQVWYSLCQNMF